MYQVFFFCAVAGGTVMILQLILAFVGLGDHDFEMGGDLPDDLPEDIDVLHGDVPHGDVPHGDVSAGESHGHFSVFRKLSLRSLVAAVTFFGLAGMASVQAGQHPGISIVIGAAAGVLALVSVSYLMRVLYGLGQDGTMRPEDALGKPGSVYLPIPGSRDGTGRVQVHLDDRIVEFDAVTSNPDKLTTGARIVVVEVLGSTLVEVEPDSEVMSAQL